MLQEAGSGHVYTRTLDAQTRTSLSVIAGLIPAGAQVLDLGTGSGALGEFLTRQQGCTVDGLTYNAHEADLARPHYRHVYVADLEQCDLPSLLGAQRYDVIVCADVLEHIRNPEQVLLACRALLRDGGFLVLSVPNAGYCGLIAELMAGDFRYREEGLLDRTHVRFFTRRTLLHLLQEIGLYPQALELIERDLPESEFSVSLDGLPPAVARYLISAPDAMVYQFVLRCGVVAPATNFDQAAIQPALEQAQFTAQLYLQHNGIWSESTKITQRGQIGVERQVLRFVLPAGARLTALRLDPADRPGYLHIFRIELLVDGQSAWRWAHGTDSLAKLLDAPHFDIVFAPPWPGASSSALLLTDSDPRIELPIPAAVLAACATAQSGELQVEAGWPMSADYLCAALALGPLEKEVHALKHQLQLQRQAHEQALQACRLESQEHISDEFRRWSATLDAAVASHTRWQNLLETQSALSADQLRQTRLLTEETERLQEELSALQARQVTLVNQNTELETEMHRERALVQDQQATMQVLQEDLLREQAMVRRLQSELETRNTTEAQLRSELMRTRDTRDAVAAHLKWIESSTVFRATRPLVHAKMWLQSLASGKAGTAQDPAHRVQRANARPAAAGVDVIVPVYKGLFDTQRCITSALQSVNQTPMRVVIINDCSPDPEVTRWLRDIAQQDTRITLLENEVNLGFVGTVNRGMSFGPSHDVVLLNSDTEVANDWLDRMRQAAYCDEHVGTVTPFSNNATICSYPKFCEENALPEGYDTARLDHLFAQANAGEVVDIPTGVGFCMYIRRDCLDQVGLFDVANFGKGYGEENDFCRRAAAAGWRNLHALDTFVLHAGGVSFGSEKNDRVMAAMQTLARLYPDYEPMVHAFIAQDPAAEARHKVDIARVNGEFDLKRLQADGRPGVLLVVHDRSGGTLRHVHELAEHLSDMGHFYTLTPTGGGGVTLRLIDAGPTFALQFVLPDEVDALLHALRGLGIVLVHFHHLIGHGDDILGLPARLGVPFDFTAHDYYTFCPQISLTDASNRYCGELGLEQCTRCLVRSPAPGGKSITVWRAKYREFLQRARTVYAPSIDAAMRMRKFLGQDVVVAPHTDLNETEQATPGRPPRVLQTTDRLRVAVIGALSPIKGADVLEDVATLAASQGAALDFHLIGYAYRHLKGPPDANLAVHGAYQESELPALLARIQPDLLWFPAQWPETYSYTLSAAIASGLPILATDLGAHSERLRGRNASWIKPWSESPAQWLATLEGLRTEVFLHIYPASSVATSAAPTPAAWAYRTHYWAGLARAADPPPLSQEFLLTHLPGRRGAGSGVASRRVKGALLHAVQRLRSAPGLSRVARAVPLRWQTRVKSWLLG